MAHGNDNIKTLQIISGPDKWGLLLRGLYEGKSVRFGTKEMLYIPHTYHNKIFARIMGIARVISASTVEEEWLIEGEIMRIFDESDDRSPHRLGAKFRGKYNSHTREGVVELTWYR
ncbi:MAG: hypothetical protein Q8P49_00520 [Candidatus Liptonbacteria bacterium]|nr:hypothetical protein [Candidatus Liptonbacteria bacterium]